MSSWSFKVIGLAWSLLVVSVHGFVWPIDNEYPPGQFKYTFSELYLYSAKDAPSYLQLSESVIAVDLDVVSKAPLSTPLELKVAVFHVPIEVIGEVGSEASLVT